MGGDDDGGGKLCSVTVPVIWFLGIALDWMSENLYWTDASMNQIWMSRADGRYQKIIARNLSQPHGIVIDMARK